MDIFSGVGESYGFLFPSLRSLAAGPDIACLLVAHQKPATALRLRRLRILGKISTSFLKIISSSCSNLVEIHLTIQPKSKMGLAGLLQINRLEKAYIYHQRGVLVKDSAFKALARAWLTLQVFAWSCVWTSATLYSVAIFSRHCKALRQLNIPLKLEGDTGGPRLHNYLELRMLEWLSTEQWEIVTPKGSSQLRIASKITHALRLLAPRSPLGDFPWIDLAKHHPTTWKAVQAQLLSSTRLTPSCAPSEQAQGSKFPDSRDRDCLHADSLKVHEGVPLTVGLVNEDGTDTGQIVLALEEDSEPQPQREPRLLGASTAFSFLIQWMICILFLSSFSDSFRLILDAPILLGCQLLLL
ncbi:hypothetical protein FRB94_014169 [Tulasnella sp. JGI-2019a]|nr:hypothetical protein FRB94_014169 [Tulasnella sp. JGI-2019a]